MSTDATVARPTRYGVGARVLHWLTVALLIAQFTVGYLLEDDDDRGRGRGRGRGGDDGESGKGRGRGRGGEDGAATESDDSDDEVVVDSDGSDDFGGDHLESTDPAATDLAGTDLLGVDLRTIHIVLGVTILLVVLVRVVWRRGVGLPPWDPSLSKGEQRFATWTERLLLASVALMAASGLLVLTEDDWLALHVGAHITFFVVVSLHVAFVLGRRLWGRPTLLRRML